MRCSNLRALLGILNNKGYVHRGLNNLNDIPIERGQILVHQNSGDTKTNFISGIFASNDPERGGFHCNPTAMDPESRQQNISKREGGENMGTNEQI